MCDSFLDACGVIELDHFAVTTNDLIKTVEDYMAIPGTVLLRGPGNNSKQNVEYAFIRLKNGEVIEILGVTKKSPMQQHVLRGGGAYHLCFLVDDIDKSISIALKNNAKEVTALKRDDAFDGRRVVFLSHSRHGLFEFLEKFPSIKSSSLDEFNNKPKDDDLLMSVFLDVFPDNNGLEYGDSELDIFPGWDSATHIALIIEIEKVFNITIKSDDFPKLVSYTAIQNYINTIVS